MTTPLHANPLIEEHELPPFGQIEPSHIVPAIEAILEDNRRIVATITEAGDFSYEGLVLRLEEIGDRLDKAWSPVEHMNGVVNSDELREAYNACLPKISEFRTELGQNRVLYQGFKTLSQSDEFDTLSAAQKKAIENSLRDFRLSGVALDDEKKACFAELSKQLSEVTSQFADHVMDATGAWSKLINDPAELSGVPDGALSLAKQAAELKGEGGYLLTLDFPSYFPVMSHCDNAELRREISQAVGTRASEYGPHAGKFDNSDLMIQILSLRKELAQLLSFSNSAENSLATKMADTPAQVMDFLNDLAVKSKAASQAEFKELEDFAETKYGIESLNPWDVAFYTEKLKKEKFDLSDEQLRPYFPAPVVISGMFQVVNKLFEIDVQETTDIATWHDDATTYDIYKDGQIIARFYLDLYARSKKRGGAWMDECRSRRELADGSVQLPVAYLTCNFPGPVGDTPALLSHNDVVTLFHEFGHGLHHMLTRIDCAAVSGIRGVAWDAVELPSQFLENWCWQRESLEFISSHYETGESLPAELLDKMLAAKNFQSAMHMVRQLEFSLFDMRLHMEFSIDEENQIQKILDEVRSQVTVVPVSSENRFQNAFSHIFGSPVGYGAGYYSYKWAEVLSADAFGLFEEEGIFNPATGEKFLSTVLSSGGSQDAMDLFVAFRGREPEVDALLRQEGIA
ncbi:MAG: oligopeptidase A [Gammaproteobacteria bacterium]|jgi:oligopeptidase A|nr:oligopeptidase A [Gammaproteobacteria bacterium]MBT3860615.1 oligopeptidase A [Gammaproteobacteria bacterium]MBT3988752.1 oligopeptidase A [Gammaproteobacteria bacterium]MBT4255614.1 oligopeptidase A [Gammaproteobacteria bacterium]MBT4582615.1 oligopeptidase A [Gammaproteobacteria bacterium]